MPIGEGPVVTIDGVKYLCDLATYAQEDQRPFAQAIREGHPSGDTLEEESQVGWRTWHGGAFQAAYDQAQGDRFASSYNVWTAIPGEAVVGPARKSTSGISAAVTRLHTPDTSGRVVALTAAAVFYRDSGADSFTSILGSVTPTDIAEFDGNYYVAMGASNAYQYKNALSAGGWTTATVAGTDGTVANLWAVGLPGTGTNAGNLWKSVNPNKVYSSADPTNAGAWTATAYKVGSSKFNINSLRIIDNRLIVGKPEGLFWLQPSGTVEPLFLFDTALHADNAKLLVQTHTGVIMANWLHGLVAFRPGGNAINVTLNEVWQQFAPGLRHSAEETRGRFVAAVAGPAATYFTLYDPISTNYYLVLWDGQGVDRGWHVIHKFGAAADVLGFEQPNAGNARVYARNGTSAPVYFKLPRDTEEPRNDSGFEFTTDAAVLTFSEHESPLPEMRKSYVHLDVRAESLSAGTVYVDVEYRVDGGSWDTLSRIDSSGSSRVNFPSNTVGRRVSLRLTLQATATASPRIRAIYLTYMLVPPSRKEWRLSLRPWLNSMTHQRAKGLLQAVKDSFAPVTYSDLDDAPYTVLVRSVGAAPVPTQAPGELVQWLVQVRLLETTGTPASVTAGSYGALERAGDYAALEARTYADLEVLAV